MRLNFYRVIDGFVAQGGDYKGARQPKVGKKGIDAEFSRKIDKSFIFNRLRGGFVKMVLIFVMMSYAEYVCINLLRK